MSGVKHTPGPWKIDFGYPRGLPGGISTMNGGRPVTRFNTFARPTSPEALANARLIAAAPDHHAVALELDRLALVIDSAVRFADPAFKDEVQALLKANKAALARARGEQDGGGE